MLYKNSIFFYYSYNHPLNEFDDLLMITKLSKTKKLEKKLYPSQIISRLFWIFSLEYFKMLKFKLLKNGILNGGNRIVIFLLYKVYYTISLK